MCRSDLNESLHRGTKLSCLYLVNCFFWKTDWYWFYSPVKAETRFKMTSKILKNRKKNRDSNPLQLWKNGVDKMYTHYLSSFLPNISAAQFDSWRICASSKSKHLHLYALVTMATADSEDEMSCLGHSVCGNRSLQHQKVFGIRLEKIRPLGIAILFTLNFELQKNAPKHSDK